MNETPGPYPGLPRHAFTLVGRTGGPQHPGLPSQVHYTMNNRPCLALAGILTCLPLAGLLAADLPPVPAESIAVKKELLFSDGFQGAQPAAVWHRVVPTFTFENGMLKGTQTRDKDVPRPDGTGVIKAHAAVYGLEIPTRDSVVEVKIKFDGATMIDVEFDDRAYAGSHYGHLCRAQVRLNGVTLIDERDGSMRNDIYALNTDPANREEVRRLLAGRRVTYPAKLEPGRWYTLVVETVGDTMRATIDGQPAGYLKSSGIGHVTKSKIELGVAGKDGYFDDIEVWNAAPAR